MPRLTFIAMVFHLGQSGHIHWIIKWIVCPVCYFTGSWLNCIVTGFLFCPCTIIGRFPAIQKEICGKIRLVFIHDQVPVWCRQFPTDPLSDNGIGRVTDSMHARQLSATCCQYETDNNQGNDIPILHTCHWIILTRLNFLSDTQFSQQDENLSMCLRIIFHYPDYISLRVTEMRHHE